jgi:sugar phosphate permease
MDTAAVKFGAVSLGLGLLTFVVLVRAWGGVGPCTDIRQVVLLILALAGIIIGGPVLLISLSVMGRRYKEYKAGDIASLFPKSDKKSGSF